MNLRINRQKIINQIRDKTWFNINLVLKNKVCSGSVFYIVPYGKQYKEFKHNFNRLVNISSIIRWHVNSL